MILFEITSGGANNDFCKNITPPPPHKSFHSNYLACILLFGAIFFYSCDPPSSSLTYTTIVSGEITRPIIYLKDPSKAKPIAGAEVWASTDPAKKVRTDTNGNYSLTVKHPGTFTVITADCKTTIPGRYPPVYLYYKASDPQTVKTTGPTHSLNIPLQYAYTIKLYGDFLQIGRSGGTAIPLDNGKIEVKVEGDIVKSTTSRNGKYSITFDHPGTYEVIASYPGLQNSRYTPVLDTSKESGQDFLLRP